MQTYNVFFVNKKPVNERDAKIYKSYGLFTGSPLVVKADNINNLRRNLIKDYAYEIRYYGLLIKTENGAELGKLVTPVEDRYLIHHRGGYLWTHKSNGRTKQSLLHPFTGEIVGD